MTISPRLDKNKIINEIESLWPRENVIVALSVRTIFDSILTSKNFEKGSEVIMTGITIPDMVKIVESHGLKIIPIDIDMETLNISVQLIEKKIRKDTTAILPVHTFGNMCNIEKIDDHVVHGKSCKCCVHRKGATRALGGDHSELMSKFGAIGQPVLVPGDMGTSSWVLAGPQSGSNRAFAS